MKTLKDIEQAKLLIEFTEIDEFDFGAGLVAGLGKKYVLRETLRQEAIKQIKELLKNEDYVGVGTRWRKDVETETWTDGFVMTKGIVHWIKHFFNISEEDINE